MPTESATSPPQTPAPASARSSGRGALLVGAGIFLSRVAGLVRESVFAHYLGNSAAGDVFRVALKIPNLLQNLFGEGVLSASFIPVYASLLAKKDDEEARRVAGAVFSLLALMTAAVVLAGMLLAPVLVDVFTPGFEAEKRTETIRLVRLMYPGVGFLVLSAWCLGVLNSHRKFFLSYVAPVAWNAAIIGALIWGGRSGYEGYALAWITAWGAFAGCLLQFVVQLPVALPLTRGIAFGLGRGSEHVTQARRSFGPVVFGRGIVQISSFVDMWLASWLPDGAVNAMGSAQTLYTLPLSLFGMAISASELPEMSREAGTSDEAIAALRERLRAGLRRIAFLVIPSAAAFIAIGDVLVALVFKSGRFGEGDVLWVWGILAALGVGLLASTMRGLYSSAFYALRDTRTPVRFALLRVGLGTALAASLAFGIPRVSGISAHWAAVGIALGSSIAAWVELALIRRALQRRIGAAGDPASVVARLVLAAVIAGAVGFGVNAALPPLHRVLTAAIVVPVFGLTYFGAVTAFGLPDARRYVDGMLRRIRR